MLQDKRKKQLRKEGVRRSKRLEKLSCSQVADNISISRDFSEAYSDKNWQETMESELESLNVHDVWDVVERPKNIKTVKSKLVFSIKRSNEDDGIRLKRDLLLSGIIKLKIKTMTNMYSSVVNIDAWRTLMAIIAKRNLNIRFF